MTEKLYYGNAYIKSSGCRVEKITTDGKITEIILDKTPFFPEGGGQPCDTGVIGGVAIYDVQENGGIIIHRTRQTPDFSEGDAVSCTVDWDKRFARMQSHSGEHIVSGIAHRLYGVENVGFHMEDTVMTVDFDRKLSDEDIKTIEEAANRAIWDNRKITAVVYSNEEAKKIEYRSKKEFDCDIRVVTIDGIDACACCAPHVSSTGEVGLIMITSCVSHRGGVRLTLVCGSSAYKLAAERYSQVKTMAGMLVEKQEECVNALSVYMKKADEARYEANLLRERICRMTADSVNVSTDGITVATCDLSPAELTKTGAMLREKAEHPVVLLSGNDGNGYAYIITAENYPLNSRAKEINSALSGRGGGRNEMIQGSFRTTLDEIKRYFKDFTL